MQSNTLVLRGRYLWIAAVALLGITAMPATADNSFADITGTNIWNNIPPELEDSIDPDLVDRIEQLNLDAEEAFVECDAAIVANAPDPNAPRRFSRRPVEVVELPVPEACQRLESLRAEAEVLRETVQELEITRSGAGRKTW